jgi:hypothetical protein
MHTPGDTSLGRSENHSSSFLAGARLHRVVSGGGGWGAKTGLLSLDPDLSYLASSPEYPLHGHRLPSFDGPEYTVNNIAKEGELIQFFASTSQELERVRKPEHSQSHSFDKFSKSKPHHTCVFGVCPSQEDSRLDPHCEAEFPKKQPLIHSFPNHFGALSEKGISIKYERYTSGHIDPTGSSNSSLTLGRSKVDVPFSSISWKTL